MVELEPRNDEEGSRNSHSEELKDQEDDTHGRGQVSRRRAIETEEEQEGDQVENSKDDLEVTLQVIREHVTLNDDEDEVSKIDDGNSDELSKRVGLGDETDEQTNENTLDPRGNDEGAITEVEGSIVGVARGGEGGLEEGLLLLDESEPDKETNGNSETEDNPEDTSNDGRSAFRSNEGEGTHNTDTQVTELESTEEDEEGTGGGKETSATAANHRDDQENNVEDDKDSKSDSPPEKEGEELVVLFRLPVGFILHPVLGITTSLGNRIVPSIVRVLRVVPREAPGEEDPVPVANESREVGGIGEVDETSNSNQLKLIDHRPELVGTLEEVPLGTTLRDVLSRIIQSTRDQGDESDNTNDSSHDVIHDVDTNRRALTMEPRAALELRKRGSRTLDGSNDASTRRGAPNTGRVVDASGTVASEHVARELSLLRAVISLPAGEAGAVVVAVGNVTDSMTSGGQAGIGALTLHAGGSIIGSCPITIADASRIRASTLSIAVEGTGQSSAPRLQIVQSFTRLGVIVGTTGASTTSAASTDGSGVGTAVSRATLSGLPARNSEELRNSITSQNVEEGGMSARSSARNFDGGDDNSNGTKGIVGLNTAFTTVVGDGVLKNVSEISSTGLTKHTSIKNTRGRIKSPGAEGIASSIQQGGIPGREVSTHLDDGGTRATNDNRSLRSARIGIIGDGSTSILITERVKIGSGGDNGGTIPTSCQACRPNNILSSGSTSGGGRESTNEHESGVVSSQGSIIGINIRKLDCFPSRSISNSSIGKTEDIDGSRSSISDEVNRRGRGDIEDLKGTRKAVGIDVVVTRGWYREGGGIEPVNGVFTIGRSVREHIEVIVNEERKAEACSELSDLPVQGVIDTSVYGTSTTRTSGGSSNGLITGTESVDNVGSRDTEGGHGIDRRSVVHRHRDTQDNVSRGGVKGAIRSNGSTGVGSGREVRSGILPFIFLKRQLSQRLITSGRHNGTSHCQDAKQGNEHHGTTRGSHVAEEKRLEVGSFFWG